MAEVLFYDKDKTEKEFIKKHLDDCVARLSGDMLNYNEFINLISAYKYIETNTSNMAMVEVTCDSEIEFLKILRSKDKNTELFLLADEKVSPMSYLTPKVRACSLLIKPFEQGHCRQTVREFVSEYYNNINSDTENKLHIKFYNTEILIKFSDIYYIDVQDKKISIRTKNNTYQQSGTLEEFSKQLPKSFVRCHRSYIFNLEHFISADFTNRLIRLDNDSLVPISRSFKSQVKEYIDELQ